jgi:polar amino acid transport system substrate-binding protein
MLHRGERKSPGFFVLVVISVALLPALAIAGNPRATIVLNTADAAPNSTPTLTGICDKVIKAAFKRIGVPVRIIRIPSERALITANDGIDDGNYARIKGMETIYPNLIRVPESIIKFEFVAFSKKSDIKISGWDSLKPYNIGFITGWKILEANITGTKSLIKVKNERVLFDVLNEDKVDIIVYDRLQGLTLLRELKYGDIHSIKPPIAVKDMYLYLHKRNKDLVPLLSDAIRGMKKDGTYNKILGESLKDTSLDRKY